MSKDLCVDVAEVVDVDVDERVNAGKCVKGYHRQGSCVRQAEQRVPSCHQEKMRLSSDERGQMRFVEKQS